MLQTGDRFVLWCLLLLMICLLVFVFLDFVPVRSFCRASVIGECLYRFNNQDMSFESIPLLQTFH